MSKYKWTDITTYSHGDKERVPRVLSLDFKGLNCNVKVHRHIYCPDTWLLSCKSVGIDMCDLVTGNLEEAKNKAIELVLSGLEKRRVEIEATIIEIKSL